MKDRFPILRWLALAVAIRLIAAFTYSDWYHPDEWFQTVEFAKLLLGHGATYSQEIGLHLRNLSWPALLTLPLSAAYAIAPNHVGLRVFSFQLFTGALDLGIFWGWWQLARQFQTRLRVSRAWLHFGFALLLLPWFTVHDSVRPSGEHLSVIATWVSLGLLARGALGWAGFFAVAIAAFKYPSGLISAGIALSVILTAHAKPDWKRRIGHFFLGVAAGLVVFGIADAVVYGRPWESLWMYFEYNVVSGLSSRYFGQQGLGIYFEFFRGRWLAALLPLGVVLAFASLRGLRDGLKRKEPWALAIVLYFGAHLLSAHKEYRFMLPLESLLLWSAWTGLVQWAGTPGATKVKALAFKTRTRKRGLMVFACLFLAANAAFLAKAIWGQTWTTNRTYFEINRHLRETPETCAVVSVRYPLSMILTDSPQGFFPGIPRRPSSPQLPEMPLIWVSRAPACSSSQKVLFHVDKPDAGWDSLSCELLPSGVLRWLPKSEWSWTLEHHYVSGVWYRCPPAVLGRFKSTSTETPFVASFDRMPELPPPGTSGSDLVRLGLKTTPNPGCKAICAAVE